MDPYLQHLVFERLVADDALDDARRDLVLAACDGADALEATLQGAGEAYDVRSVQPELPVDPPGAYLGSIAVNGFRGVGAEAVLPLAIGPGLTLVVGRNGSGKSSFAEGLELLMTGANLRWEKRTRIWREGWQNLHYQGETELRAELHVDGVPGTVSLRRRWPRGADVTAGGALELAGGEAGSMADLGWDVALSRYRPFLSYNELGSMFDEPKTMYDALATILGLEDVDAAAEALRAARLERDRALRAYKDRRAEFMERLGDCSDERARAVERGLNARAPDLDTVELALAGVVEGGDLAGELTALRSLARLEAPDAEAASAARTALEQAEADLDGLRGTESARDAGAAELLEKAVAHHRHHPGEQCPVCGTPGVLDEAWRERAAGEAVRLRERAAAFDAAERAVATRRRAVRDLAPRIGVPALRAAAEAVGLDAEPAVDALRAWSEDPVDLPAGLASLSRALDALGTAAREELGRREDAWRPVATDLRDWLPVGRAALAGIEQSAALKEAETWMRSTAAELQAGRLAPIADAAKANWEALRQESNVNLDGFHLRKRGTTRAAEIDVHVDGTGSSALSVMSQGELNALAVSVFLPRAGFSESPFRFMVIDDPVQSMDPAKVDGLARVLAGAAAARQVVVFTHDERLPEAVRRLSLDATVLEVTRRPGSVVEVRPALDPVERYLDDARALLRSEGVPPEVTARVVPGFCRHALEAGAATAVRRRRIGRGDRHADVEEAFTRATTLYKRLALAIFDDEERSGDVVGTINSRFGRRSGDAVVRANRGVHEDLDGDLRDFVSDSARLALELAALR